MISYLCLPWISLNPSSYGFLIVVSIGLSFYTTTEELRRLFLPFGDIKEARLVIDHRTQRPKGFGFVTFESETDAQNALKALNGKVRFSSCIAVIDLPLGKARAYFEL
nr:cold-inducible RNA-binding protein [Ipomoea batatas]